MTQRALVIDLNVCVGCQACVTSCKAWNTSGESGSLTDVRPYDADPLGTFFNRVQTYEAGAYPDVDTVHFPKSCLHCEEPPCVPVCPTGASYKRASDGLVLVDYDRCIGCKYCAWACPYGARELDEGRKEMTKCTLCADRIDNAALPERDRQPACVLACPTSARIFGDIHDPESPVARAIRENGGYALMPEWGTRPANHYLPRRRGGGLRVDPSAADLSAIDATVSSNARRASVYSGTSSILARLWRRIGEASIGARRGFRARRAARRKGA